MISGTAEVHGWGADVRFGPVDDADEPFKAGIAQVWEGALGSRRAKILPTKTRDWIDIHQEEEFANRVYSRYAVSGTAIMTATDMITAVEGYDAMRIFP